MHRGLPSSKTISYNVVQSFSYFNMMMINTGTEDDDHLQLSERLKHQKGKRRVSALGVHQGAGECDFAPTGVWGWRRERFEPLEPTKEIECFIKKKGARVCDSAPRGAEEVV